MQRRREARRFGAEMAERDQRQRRIERVHLGHDQLALHIGQHPASDETRTRHRDRSPAAPRAAAR